MRDRKIRPKRRTVTTIESQQFRRYPIGQHSRQASQNPVAYFGGAKAFTLDREARHFIKGINRAEFGIELQAVDDRKRPA